MTLKANQGSMAIVQFNRSHITLYQWSVVTVHITVHLSRIVSETFNVE